MVGTGALEGPSILAMEGLRVDVLFCLPHQAFISSTAEQLFPWYTISLAELEAGSRVVQSLIGCPPWAI